jgi:signal peptidase II
VIVLAAAAAVLVIDAATKAVVTGAIAEGRVQLVYNRRAALSVAQSAALLAVIAAAVLAAAPHGATALGLGMAIGGAAGNLADRVRRGAVVDFVALGPWPVFNLADAAMTVGLLVAAVSVL